MKYQPTIFNKNVLNPIIKGETSLQITAQAIQELERRTTLIIGNLFRIIEETKTTKSRITDVDVIEALKKVTATKKKEENGKSSCPRCKGLNDDNLKFGFQLQDHIINETKIALNSMERNKRYVK